ncbi:10783_t:CDS:2 [Ambispora gerdemannii]|uniref:10783_t:CDS:1 n=1 Tax=Ambispora gerdemannii TaxID=144530 RepID=A0A9N8WMJ2_9GLOM|nr:10783_t:CDS:2 [Ambispora gerdemannii]
MMKHHQQNDSNYHSEATITPTICSIAAPFCPDFEHELSTESVLNSNSSNTNNNSTTTITTATVNMATMKECSSSPMEQPLTPHSPTPPPPSHQPEELQLQRQQLDDQVVPPDLDNLGLFTPVDELNQKYEIPYYNNHSDTLTYSATSMPQQSIFDNDYNVALTLAKDMSIPHFSYPQDESQLFTTMAECFPIQANVEDVQSYVNGLASPDLSQHSKFSPHSTFSPLSPLSPLDEQTSLFDFDTKVYSHDMPPSLDSRDFFASDSFVHNKSFDETLFLRKFAGASIKHESESHVYRRNKSSSQQHAPYPIPSPTNSDISQRLHIETALAPPPTKSSRRTTKSAAPFACPHEHCPKTFTRQYNLKSHLRTHTDERPFICNYPGCPRAFARQHDLKRHQKLHLGLKPHVCTNCGRAFARLDALNRHLRSDNAAQCAQATLAANRINADMVKLSELFVAGQV